MAMHHPEPASSYSLSEPVFGCPSALGKSAVQPHNYTATDLINVNSDRLQLSCFKLGARDLSYLALLAGGLAFSTVARQPLELKRSARDRMMI
jgi:hypothetical protein